MADEKTKLLSPTNEDDDIDDLPKLRIDRVSLFQRPSTSMTNLLKTPSNKIRQQYMSTGQLKQPSFFSNNKSLLTFTRISITFFIFILIFAIFAIVVTFIPVIDLWITFLVIFIGTIIGSLIGCNLLYKWDVVSNRLFTDLREEGNKMIREEDKLKLLKDNLKNDVIRTQSSISSLARNASSLEEELKQYDALRIALQERADENESINDILQKFLGIIDQLKFLTMENAKAMVITRYYHVAFKDHEFGINKKYYTQLLHRLDSETRAIFIQFGGFEKYDQNNDGIIDINEFMFMLEEVMQQIEEAEVKRLFNKTTTK